MAVVCKGCVYLREVSVVYYGVLRQSFVVNWRWSVGGVLYQIVEAGWRLSASCMLQFGVICQLHYAG